MSYDFALSRPCEHQVWFEITSLDAFIRDTIRFQRQPNAESTVHVYIDGIEVPKAGLNAPAFITSTQKEPFNIKNGVNDLFFIQIGNEVPITLTLLSGTSLKAADIAKFLQRQVPDLIFSPVNGHIQIAARTSSISDTFSFPNPVWLDKTQSLPSTGRILAGFKEIGIIPGRVCNPINIYPGWNIILDPNSFVDEKVVLFNKPLRNSSPFIQLTYSTAPGNCRRCFGSLIEFDYGVINGHYETVNNTDLLLQEFEKFLFTDLGSHWKWPWLGSRLNERIGGKYIVSNGSTNAFITMDISQAFKSYQNIKSQQDGAIFQQVTDAEFPANFTDLSVVTDPNDPTIAVVSGSLVSRSTIAVPLQRIIGNPSTFLSGSGQPPLLQSG